MTRPALSPPAARNLAVRLAFTCALSHWRIQLAGTERQLADAIECGAAFEIELYTDMVLRLQGDIKHVADALREMP